MKQWNGSLISEEEKSYFKSIYNKYHQALFLYAGRLTGQPAVAEDLAQDAFLKLLHAKKVFDDEESVKAFLLATVRNACVDVNRHATVVRKNEPLLAAHLDSHFAPPDQERMRVEMAAWGLVLQHIEALPEDQRRIAEESLIKGRNNRAVAAILGEKYHRVRYVKQGVIKRLQQLLRDNRD